MGQLYFTCFFAEPGLESSILFKPKRHLSTNKRHIGVLPSGKIERFEFGFYYNYLELMLEDFNVGVGLNANPHFQ